MTPQTGKIIFLVIAAALFGFFVSITAAFFWTVFLAFVLFNIESKIIAQAALICLICLPVLLATGKTNVAEQVAVYAYYLLVMTVVLQIIELKRSPESEPPQPLMKHVRKVSTTMRRKIVDVIPVKQVRRRPRIDGLVIDLSEMNKPPLTRI